MELRAPRLEAAAAIASVMSAPEPVAEGAVRGRWGQPVADLERDSRLTGANRPYEGAGMRVVSTFDSSERQR